LVTFFATLSIAEGADAANTAVGTFKIALAADAAGGIRDLAGNAASFNGTAPADRAAPARTLMEALDASPSGTARDGRIDQVKVTFSETLVNTTNAAQWAFGGTVPSAGTLSGVAATGTSATLTVAPGNATPNTAIGTWTVALAASATGIRDSAGNQASFAATAPADEAAPVPTTLTDSDGSIDGRFQANDTATATFSESVLSTVISSTATLSGPNNATATDSFSAPGFMNAGTLGRFDYIIGNQAAPFTSSTIDQPAPTQVRLTLGACSDTTPCAALGTAALAGSITFVPAATITDAAGNARRRCELDHADLLDQALLTPLQPPGHVFGCKLAAETQEVAIDVRCHLCR
jgi:hypothetical protein